MPTVFNKEILTEVQSSKQGLAMQLGETTDVSNCAQLLLYVRYAIKDSIGNELQLSNQLRTTTRGEDVFELVKDFFAENGL